MQVNIQDYLSDEEIKDIMKFELRAKIRGDSERILSNMAYHVVFKAVDEALGEDAQEIIKKKVIEVIENLSAFHILRNEDAFGKFLSPGQRMLNNTLTENEPLIKRKVTDALAEYDFKDELGEKDMISKHLLEALRKGLCDYE